MTGKESLFPFSKDVWGTNSSHNFAVVLGTASRGHDLGHLLKHWDSVLTCLQFQNSSSFFLTKK